MENVYNVSLDDGRSFTVTTANHHDNHSDDNFKAILFEIIRQYVPGIISGGVVSFSHKGER